MFWGWTQNRAIYPMSSGDSRLAGVYEGSAPGRHGRRERFRRSWREAVGDFLSTMSNIEPMDKRSIDSENIVRTLSTSQGSTRVLL